MRRLCSAVGSGAIGRAAALRIIAMFLGLAASIAIARLGGAEVKGVYSAFAAGLSLAFLFVNFDLPQQALRAARAESAIDAVLPWMRRPWLAFLAAGSVVSIIGLIFVEALVPYGIGLAIVTVSTQAGVVAMGTRGPVNYAVSAVVQQGVALALALMLGLAGYLTTASAVTVVLVSLAVPLIVLWKGAPISVFSQSTLNLNVKRLLGGGAAWQTVRSLQTAMLKIDLLWVTFLMGPKMAGIYSVAVSTAMLVNIVPQQISNQLLSDVLRRKSMEWRRPLLLGVLSGFGTALVLGLAAWPLLPLVYGTEFAASRVPMVVAMCGAVAYGGLQVVSNYVRNLGTRRDYLAFMAPGAVAMIGTLLISVPRAGLVGAAVSFAVGMSASTAFGAMVSSKVKARVVEESADD